MDCNRVQLEIDSAGANGAEAPLAAELRGHLAECPTCRAYAADVARVRACLMAEALPPLPRHLRLTPSRLVTSAWESRLALAAGFLLMLGAAALIGPRFRSPPMAPAALAEAQTRTVVLALDSATELHDVTLRLILPPGAEIVGNPGVSELEWRETLAVGANRLRIPLVITAGTQGSLLARIEHQGRQREIHVPLAPISEPNTREPKRKQGASPGRIG